VKPMRLQCARSRHAYAESLHDKEKALLAEIIAKVNDLFEGDLTDDELVYPPEFLRSGP
jgi:hypothetical protein